MDKEMREQLSRTEAEKELNIRQRRRLELIKNYDWEILYHSGKANMVADALSKKERLKMIMSFGEFIRDFEKMEIVVKGIQEERLKDNLRGFTRRKDEVVERKMLGPAVVQRTKDMIDLIRGRLVVAQDGHDKLPDSSRAIRNPSRPGKFSTRYTVVVM
ncbi:hypothetical protein AgCh_003941 [Apium graveolens]